MTTEVRNTAFNDVDHSIWSLPAYIIYNEDLRAADKELRIESDRRYGEVNIEREKALKIKDTADRDALELSRKRQEERDTQSDAMRDQTLASSGVYATNASVAKSFEKLEETLAPFIKYVAELQGAGAGNDKSAIRLSQLVAGVVGIGLLYLATK